MKPEELMLGDIVTFKDCLHDENPVVIKIWQINQDGDAFVYIDNDTALDEISIDDDVVGLPLTPEILEKNGFEKDLDSDGIHHRFTFIEGHTKFSILYARNVFQWLGPLDFKYVHELQHALRLCGIEKEIVL